jgi:hypothetical protein
MELTSMRDDVLDKEEELPKPRFSLDPLVQAAAYESTRKHYLRLQWLNALSLAFSLLLLLVPFWFSYEGVQLGLDRVLLSDQWVSLRSVSTSQCLQQVSDLVCLALERFYIAGVAFKCLWGVGLLAGVHNTANLYATLHYRSWWWAKFEFLHLIAPVLMLGAFLLWCALAGSLEGNLQYEAGSLGALAVGLGQCGLAACYYRAKLLEDESSVSTYLALPS